MGLAWSTGKNRTFIFQIQSNLIISMPDWQQVQKIYGEKVGVPLSSELCKKHTDSVSPKELYRDFSAAIVTAALLWQCWNQPLQCKVSSHTAAMTRTPVLVQIHVRTQWFFGKGSPGFLSIIHREEYSMSEN